MIPSNKIAFSKGLFAFSVQLATLKYFETWDQ